MTVIEQLSREAVTVNDRDAIHVLDCLLTDPKLKGKMDRSRVKTSIQNTYLPSCTPAIRQAIETALTKIK